MTENRIFYTNFSFYAIRKKANFAKKLSILIGVFLAIVFKKIVISCLSILSISIVKLYYQTIVKL